MLETGNYTSFGEKKTLIPTILIVLQETFRYSGRLGLDSQSPVEPVRRTFQNATLLFCRVSSAQDT